LFKNNNLLEESQNKRNIHDFILICKQYKKGGDKMKRLLALVFILIGMTGCVEDKPRPEGNVILVPLHVTNVSNDVVEVVSQSQLASLNIKHYVRNKDVYVECYIPNFSFKEKGGNKVSGEGHIEVSVDGKKIDDMNTAAFIVKGLDRGVHEMMVEVVHNDSTTYDLKKIWTVSIQ
jgi:hypothetical protein